MNDKIHKFELSGLGKAPFRFHGIRENAFSPAPGEPSKAGGCCDYCSTGIRWECVIVSADGVQSVVGTDCIGKVGDKGLVNKARQARNELKRKEKRDAREAEYEALLAAQRERNGGLTDNEVAEQNYAESERVRDEAISAVIAPAAGLIDILADGRGGFRDSVADDIEFGHDVSPYAFDLACEIIAKAAGRKNSKAYNARLPEVVAELTPAFEAAKSIRTKWAEARFGN